MDDEDADDDDDTDSLDIKPPQRYQHRDKPAKKSSANTTGSGSSSSMRLSGGGGGGGSERRKHSKEQRHSQDHHLEQYPSRGSRSSRDGREPAEREHSSHRTSSSSGSRSRGAVELQQQQQQHYRDDRHTHSYEQPAPPTQHYRSSGSASAAGPKEYREKRNSGSSSGASKLVEPQTEAERALEDLRSRLLSKRNKYVAESRAAADGVREPAADTGYHQRPAQTGNADDYHHRHGQSGAVDGYHRGAAAYDAHYEQQPTKRGGERDRHRSGDVVAAGKRHVIELIDSPDQYGGYQHHQQQHYDHRYDDHQQQRRGGATTESGSNGHGRHALGADAELHARRAKLLVDGDRQRTHRRDVAREEQEARRRRRDRDQAAHAVEQQPAAAAVADAAVDEEEEEDDYIEADDDEDDMVQPAEETRAQAAEELPAGRRKPRHRAGRRHKSSAAKRAARDASPPPAANRRRPPSVDSVVHVSDDDDDGDERQQQQQQRAVAQPQADNGDGTEDSDDQSSSSSSSGSGSGSGTDSDDSENTDDDEGGERSQRRRASQSPPAPAAAAGAGAADDVSDDGELPVTPPSLAELAKPSIDPYRGRGQQRGGSVHDRRRSRSRSRSSRGSAASDRTRSRSQSRSRSRSHSRRNRASRSPLSTSPVSPEARRERHETGATTSAAASAAAAAGVGQKRERSPSSEYERELRGSGPKKAAAVPPASAAPAARQPSAAELAAEEAAARAALLPNYYPGVQGCRSVEEFQCLNRIEEGTYGVVYRARDKRTEEIVALKRLKMEKEKEGFPITSLREINTLLKGQHPNIVTVREIVVGSNMDKIFIVMDYVEHDLKSLMETMRHRKQSFLPGEVKCLTQQLLRAVGHLHDNWILHRDLKTSNLLLSHKGILKVGDFGLAREYGSPLKPYTSVVVTLWYRAPELLLCCKEYSHPIDMWSVGCIFAEFLAMGALFPGKSEVDQLSRIFKDLGTPNEKIWPGYNELPAVQKMTFTEYPVSHLRKKFAHLTSEQGLQLLQGLLTYDPKQRLSAELALRAAYFRELPLPIDPAMFPTWPAKSELGARKALASSPKPPSGGGQFKQLQAGDAAEVVAAEAHESRGFVLNAGMGGGGGAGIGLDGRPGMQQGGGFSLRF